MRKVSAVGRENQIVGREEGDFALERWRRVGVDGKHVCRAGCSDCVIHDNLKLPRKRASGRLNLNMGKSCEHAGRGNEE